MPLLPSFKFSPELSYIIYEKNGGQHRYEYIVLRNLNDNLKNLKISRGMWGQCRDPLLWVSNWGSSGWLKRVRLLPTDWFVGEFLWFLHVPGCAPSFWHPLGYTVELAIQSGFCPGIWRLIFVLFCPGIRIWYYYSCSFAFTHQKVQIELAEPANAFRDTNFDRC